MEFHEDTIFKIEGQSYGQELLEIINIKGKLVEVHQTEYGIIDPKMYKPDMVFELEDKIVILEFQSTYVDINDKKRFRFYTALFDQIKNTTNKDIEVHVLSTVELEKVKCYKINQDSRFPVYIHSLKEYDGDEFLNRMNDKIANNIEITKKELLMISLLCFMSTTNDVEHTIQKSAVTITNISDLESDIAQFVKGVVLMLCDKFVEDELLNMEITNLVGGNMKNVEAYAQRVADKKVNEKSESFVINLDKKGFTIHEIAETAEVSVDFVKKTLAK